MKLKLGLGLPFADDDGAISGTIPPTTPPGGEGGGGSGGFEGHQTPPTVEVVEDTVVIHGKTKAGFVGRIVVPLGALVAGRTYNVNVVADLSGLALGGAKAGIGFGFKTGNDFRLELLQGNAGSTRLATISGSPPTNGWNKNTGHTVAAHGAPTNGTQHAMDIQMIVNEGGDAYTFSTSGDDQASWDPELVDQTLAPFDDIAEIESGAAIAAYFSSDDFGTYVITVTWVEQDVVLWTPAEIATILWMESDDAANFTLSGSAVDQWDDMSTVGTNHFTEGTAGNKPTRETSSNLIGGLPTVSFDGSADRLTKLGLSGWPADDAVPVTIVMVARVTANSNEALYDISTSTLTNTTSQCYVAADSGGVLTQRVAGIPSTQPIVPYTDTSGAHIVSNEIRNGYRTIYVDGGMNARNATPTSRQAYTNMRIGQLFQDVFSMAGQISAVVAFKGESHDVKCLVEGYLAHKYSIPLVVSHPYADSAPVVGDPVGKSWNPHFLGGLWAWYDSIDADNFNLSGSSVDLWDDLSGNSRHEVGVTTSRPTRETVSAFGDVNAVKFDGSNDSLSFAGVTSFFQPMSFAAIYRTGSTIDDLETLHETGIANGMPLTFKWSGVSNKPHIFAGNNVARSNTVLSTSTSYIDITQVNGVNSYTRLNGNAADPVSFDPGANSGSATLQIGGSGRAGFTSFGGHIGGYYMIPRPLGLYECQLTEGYYAHRFSRSADLPSGHPHKNAAPAIDAIRWVLFDTVLGTSSTGWNGNNIRNVLSAALIPADGDSLRITFIAGSEGFKIAGCYVGHQASSGDAYDFDGTQVQVTFNGGSTSATVPVNQTLVSDKVTYAVDKTKALVVAFYCDDGANDNTWRGNLSASQLCQNFWKTAASEISTSNVSGYTQITDNIVGINKLEVYST